jgi:prevent-host-death family protein
MQPSPQSDLQKARQTVGIRELKQSPSEIIAKAASGVRFEVLSNGKPVGVVIQRETSARSRWVGSAALAALAPLASSDTTGWVDELRAERELVDDPILDPWVEATGRADA